MSRAPTAGIPVPRRTPGISVLQSQGGPVASCGPRHGQHRQTTVVLSVLLLNTWHVHTILIRALGPARALPCTIIYSVSRGSQHLRPHCPNNLSPFPVSLACKAGGSAMAGRNLMAADAQRSGCIGPLQPPSAMQGQAELATGSVDNSWIDMNGA